MNDAFKIIMFIVSGVVIGATTTILVRWLTNRYNKSRVGTDANHIGKIETGVKQLTDPINKLDESIRNTESTNKAIKEQYDEFDRLCRQFEHIVRDVESRQQGVNSQK